MRFSAVILVLLLITVPFMGCLEPDLPRTSIEVGRPLLLVQESRNESIGCYMMLQDGIIGVTSEGTEMPWNKVWVRTRDASGKIRDRNVPFQRGPTFDGSRFEATYTESTPFKRDGLVNDGDFLEFWMFDNELLGGTIIIMYDGSSNGVQARIDVPHGLAELDVTDVTNRSGRGTRLYDIKMAVRTNDTMDIALEGGDNYHINVSSDSTLSTEEDLWLKVEEGGSTYGDTPLARYTSGEDSEYTKETYIFIELTAIVEGYSGYNLSLEVDKLGWIAKGTLPDDLSGW
jgi:hypothetical protein